MKKAFTLMEILVSITIIGVIATLIVPNAINTTPNTNLEAYKSAYYAITEAAGSVSSDSILYPQDVEDNVLASPNITDKSKEYLAAVSSADVSSENIFCYAIASKMSSKGNEISCSGESFENWDAINSTDLIPNFKLLNGAEIYGLQGEFIADTAKLVFVDTNGADKPNKEGKDRFKIKIAPSGKVYIGQPEEFEDNDSYKTERSILSNPAKTKL